MSEEESRWNSVTPGKPVLDQLDRDIASWKRSVKRHDDFIAARRVFYAIAALAILFCLYMWSLEVR